MMALFRELFERPSYVPFEQCALMHIFFKNYMGCVLIRACALIRTNMVYDIQTYYRSLCILQRTGQHFVFQSFALSDHEFHKDVLLWHGSKLYLCSQFMYVCIALKFIKVP